MEEAQFRERVAGDADERAGLPLELVFVRFKKLLLAGFHW